MPSFNLIQEYISPDMKASQAKTEDTPAVIRLLVRTAEWLKSTGSNQWSALLSGEDSHDTAGSIKRGDVFVFHKDDILAGMVILFQQPSAWDVELWGEKGHETSVYLHRLAINRDYAGQGLGGQIMRWAESGIRFPGKDRIRLDCMASNPVLNPFYSRLGYDYKGNSTNQLGSFNLYEKISPYHQ